MSRWASLPSPTPRQHALLVTLRTAERTGQRLSVGEIAEALERSPQTIHESLSVLAREGFVSQSKQRRSTELTDKGRDAADKPIPAATANDHSRCRRAGRCSIVTPKQSNDKPRESRKRESDATIGLLAKNGDRSALSELLRRCAPKVRRLVWSAASQQRRTFSVYDDAVSEAMVSLWRSIQAWDPTRAPLVSFARDNILRAVWRVTAESGHAVSLPVAVGVSRKDFSACARRRARSMDQPVECGDGSDSLGETLAAALPDHDALMDADRICSVLGSADVNRLLAGFAGEERMTGEGTPALAASQGITREMGRRLHNRAKQRLEAIAKARGLR